jgi:anti-sigma-K factor RskA
MMTGQPLSNQNECEAISELIPAYAMGMTDAEETRMVEANLNACPDAAAELAEYRRLADEMRDNVPQMEVPPALGARLLLATMPSTPTRHWFTPRLRDLSLIAAVFLLIFTNVYWLTRPQPSVTLPEISNVQWTRLENPEGDEPLALVMWNEQEAVGILYVMDFPPLPDNMVYQLWLYKEGENTSAGVFRVNEGGWGTLQFHAAEPLSTFENVRITPEPVGGSDWPTAPDVVFGSVWTADDDEGSE